MNVTKMTIQHWSYRVEEEVFENPTFIPRVGDTIIMAKGGTVMVREVRYYTQQDEVVVITTN